MCFVPRLWFTVQQILWDWLLRGFLKAEMGIFIVHALLRKADSESVCMLTHGNKLFFAVQYMKKLHMQERAVEEVKLAIKPFYQKREITKEEYKNILRKAVQKVRWQQRGGAVQIMKQVAGVSIPLASFAGRAYLMCVIKTADLWTLTCSPRSSGNTWVAWSKTEQCHWDCSFYKLFSAAWIR